MKSNQITGIKLGTSESKRERERQKSRKKERKKEKDDSVYRMKIEGGDQLLEGANQ